MHFRRKVCLGFSRHRSAWVFTPQGKRPAACSHPLPMLLLQSSIRVCSVPTVSNHWFLCCCRCGIKAYDGIWKRINNCCNKPRGQALASGIYQKQTWVMISEENKAFIPGCREWCHPAGCFFVLLCGWVQAHLAREAQHHRKTSCLKTEDNPKLQTHLGGKHQPLHVLGDFIFRFFFGSHKSPTSSLFLLAKGQGPGQGFWKSPGRPWGVPTVLAAAGGAHGTMPVDSISRSG